MRIILTGHPNVGKSSVLNLLCGRRTMVSNYPGTTVQRHYARLLLSCGDYQLVDTPGLYSLKTPSFEQALVKDVLSEAQAIIHVIDATDLARHLPLAIEFISLHMPLVVCVNQMDRARSMGIVMDLEALAREMGVPMVAVSARLEEGREELVREIMSLHEQSPFRRAWISEWDGLSEGEKAAKRARWEHLVLGHRHVLIQQELWMRRPWLVAIMGFAVFSLMARIILGVLSHTEALIGQLLAPHSGQDVQGGTEGLFHYMVQGLVVPLGVVVPAMLFVYLMLSVLEDSGLFARFAALVHAPCKRLGLSGACVIPLILGTGCRLVGVLASRSIAGRRERAQTGALLAIAVPCAASLAVTGALVAKQGAQIEVIVASVFLAAFTITILWRGKRTPLVMELGPLRIPSWGNVIHKTAWRMRGFFLSVLPVLIAGHTLVRWGLERGFLDGLSQYDSLTLGWFGLCGRTLAGVSVTVVQRYLAPMVLLGLELSAREATIAAAMVLVSLPCLPVAIMCWRELGGRQTVRIWAVALVLPLFVGHLLHRLLPL